MTLTSRIVTEKSLKKHKDKALAEISAYIDSLAGLDNKQKSRADKLCFWLRDYIRFIGFENQFDHKAYVKYNRGDIIRAHLGFRIGSEQGGLHYAVVIEDNSYRSGIVTVIPLTSAKADKQPSEQRCELALGHQIYEQVTYKLSSKVEAMRKITARVLAEIDEIESGKKDATALVISNLEAKLRNSDAVSGECDRLLAAIGTMKVGSVALINQITTISKLRIYEPKHIRDVLYGIKLSNDSLDKIDELIVKKFTKREAKIMQKV